MTLSSSLCLTVYVPYVHLLPEYRPQLDVAMPPEDVSISWHVAYCLKLYDSSIGDFPYHPLETNTPTILNDSRSRNPVDLNQKRMKV
jgi:hypothetical protein